MPLKPASPTSEAPTGVPPARTQLMAELDAPEAARRRQAARALAGVPEAVEALCARLEKEADVAVWDAILTSLAQTGGPSALRGLLRYLRAEPAQLRNEVLETLKTFPEQQMMPHIEALLAGPDPHVRIAAILLIQALGYPAGVKLLISVLEHEEHVNVVATAVELLTEMGTPDVAPALESARARFASEPFLVFAIDTALTRIRGGTRG